MSSRVLRTKEKIVAVRSFEEGYKLCAFDSQNPDNHSCTVTFKEHKDHQNKSWIAFVFRIEQDKMRDYVLQANDSSLKLVAINSPNEVDGNLKCCWFQKAGGGGGDYYSVRTMVSPTHYICIEESRTAVLFLSDVAECAKVRDEPVRTSRS